MGVEEVSGDNLNAGDADLPAVGRFVMMIMIFQTMKDKEHNLSVTFEQILSLVHQCSQGEKNILVRELMKDSLQLMQMSEKSLSRDWLTTDEDEAWKDL